MNRALLALALLLPLLAVALLPAHAGAMVFNIRYVHIINATMYNYTVPQGMPFTFTARFTVVNGTPPYTIYLFVNGIEWYAVSGVVADHIYMSVVVPGNLTAGLAPGKYIYIILVVDANGNAAVSPPGSINVTPGLKAAIAAIRGPPRLIQYSNVTLMAVLTGGAPPYYYSWYVNGTSYGGDSSTIWVVPSAPGPLNVTLVVHDSFGERATAYTTLLVSPAPSVELYVPGQVDVGVPVNVGYKVYDSAGAPYNVSVLVNGSKASTTFTPDAVGAYNVSVVLSSPWMVRPVVNYTVMYVVPPPSVTISISAEYSNAFYLTDNCVVATASVAHGTQPYSFIWYLNGRPVGSGSTVYACGGAGLNRLSVTVTDAYGKTATNEVYWPGSYNFTPIILIVIGVTGVIVVARVLMSGRVRYTPV